MIGGTDVVFWVTDQEAAVRAVLHVVGLRWKDCVFQNADDLAPLPRPPAGTLPAPSGDQFFLYRDEAAARSWEAFGAVPENANTMLHVLTGKRRRPGTDYHSLTVVCDDVSGEMKEILEEIEVALRPYVAAGNGVGGVREPDAALRE